MRKLILAGLALGLMSAPALARTHPNPDAYLPIDIAAQPAYPETAPIQRHYRHSSAHALRRSRSRRPATPRHVDQKPPRRAEEAYKRPRISDSVEGPVRVTGNALDASAAILGAILGIPEGWADGMAEPMPAIVHRRPYRLEGDLIIGDRHFRYVSGGAGRGSIPYGDHRIDDSEGDWGKRHGALGLDDGTIYDPQIGSDREGIEIHAGSSRTLGCVAVENYRALKHAILAMIEDKGRAFLHVWPGYVTISPVKHEAVTVVYVPEVEHVRKPRRYRRVARL